MKLKLIVIILLSGFLGYSTYWAFLALNSEAYIARAQEDIKANGLTFQYTDYELSGYPYRLVFTFQDPVFTFHNGPFGLELQADHLEAIGQPWNLSHFIFFTATATARLSLKGKMAGEITLNPASLGFSIHALGNGNYRLSSEMEEVKLASNYELPLPEKFSSLEIHLRKQLVASTPDGNLLEPKLLELAMAGLTARGTDFRINASFRGHDVPPMTPEGLASWRDQGGTLELEQMEIGDRTGFVKGSGSLTLDQDFNPLGVISLKSESWEQIVSLFQENQWLDQNSVAIINQAIDILPEPEEESGVSLTLTLQGGYIFLGPIRIGELVPIIPE